MADRVAALYAGRIVEEGTVDDVFSRPPMPYTCGLLESSPRPDRRWSQRLAQHRRAALVAPGPAGR